MFKEEVSFSKSANFSAFSHITYRFLRQILPKLQAFTFLKLGPFLRSNIASVCRFYFCSTHLTRTEKTAFRKEG